MKSLLNTALSFFIIAAGLFALNRWDFSFAPPPACAKPITYNIGAFDRRFGISHENFLKALALAEAIWEKPSGRDLFSYSPEKATLPINLIYDYRQETTSTLTDLGETLERTEETYNAMRATYLGLKVDYDKAKAAYESRVVAFNSANDAFAERVEAWNGGSRTSKSEFEALGRAREALEREAAELKRLERELNRIVDEINRMVGELNSLATELNLEVERYNTIGASRGETFTGGVYYENSGKRGIDIFEFSNQDKLVRILAHELGHALGLEHHADPEGIMYRLNKGENIAPSATDLASLEALCGAE